MKIKNIVSSYIPNSLRYGKEYRKMAIRKIKWNFNI